MNNPITPAMSILATGNLDAYKTQTQKQTPVTIMNKTREEGGFDLIEATRQILSESGLGQNIQFFDTNHHIVNAKSLNYEAQRFILNTYFRIQLMSINESSTDERFNLIDTGSPQDWLRLFQHFIVPFLIKHNLPKSI